MKNEALKQAQALQHTLSLLAANAKSRSEAKGLSAKTVAAWEEYKDIRHQMENVQAVIEYLKGN